MLKGKLVGKFCFHNFSRRRRKKISFKFSPNKRQAIFKIKIKRNTVFQLFRRKCREKYVNKIINFKARSFSVPVFGLKEKYVLYNGTYMLFCSRLTSLCVTLLSEDIHYTVQHQYDVCVHQQAPPIVEQQLTLSLTTLFVSLVSLRQVI